MDPVQQKLTELENKVDAIYASVEKTRKYFLITMIITVAAIILPLIGLAFAIPNLLDTYSKALNF
jgi:hypothetical protein